MYVFPEEIRRAYELLPIPFVIDQLIDGKAFPLLVSDGFCELVEMDRERTVAWFKAGQFERIHPDDVGKVAHVSEEFIGHRSGYNVLFRCKHKDGYHYIHAIGGWMTMPDGTELAALTYTDVSESRSTITAAAREYDLFQQDLFFTDPITGLPNVNYLHKYADEKVHSIRVRGCSPALIYLDINFMQSYNNQYGFEEGNRLLQLTAETMRNHFPGGLVTRGSDDHFILICALEDQKELEQDIHSTGFYHNKAKNIIACCRKLIAEYGGEVPSDIDALTALPGVGRKTANVIRGNIYGIPSIVVDTHVKRISRKLGLTENEDPVKIEYDLMKILPEDHWILWNIHIITLGRTICKAPKPDCSECFLCDLCPSCYTQK